MAQNASKVARRINFQTCATNQNRVDDRRPLARFRVTDEEPVLFPDRRWANRVFHRIVIDGDSTMGEVSREVAPNSKRVVAGFPERALGQGPSSQNS